MVPTPRKERKMNDSGNGRRILLKIAKITLTTILCLVATLVAFMLPLLPLDFVAMKKIILSKVFPQEPGTMTAVIIVTVIPFIPFLVMATVMNNAIFAKIWGWRPILKENKLRKLLAKLILKPIAQNIAGNLADEAAEAALDSLDINEVAEEIQADEQSIEIEEPETTIRRQSETPNKTESKSGKLKEFSIWAIGWLFWPTAVYLTILWSMAIRLAIIYGK